MNPIVYIDGKLADAMGGMFLRALGQSIADSLNLRVDIMTHGPSEYHSDKRITCKPAKSQ